MKISLITKVALLYLCICALLVGMVVLLVNSDVEATMIASLFALGMVGISMVITINLLRRQQSLLDYVSSLEMHVVPPSLPEDIAGKDQIGRAAEMIHRLHQQLFVDREVLAQNEERMDLALSGAGLGMWDWNIKTGDVLFSTLWTEMLGYAEGELSARVETWQELMHPEDSDGVLDALDRHFKNTEKQYQAEFRLKTKSGGWKWILARGRVMEKDKKGRPVRMVGTHLDVSDRKEEEQKMIRTQRMEALGAMAGGLSHEINNFLQPIITFSELIREDDRPQL